MQKTLLLEYPGRTTFQTFIIGEENRFAYQALYDAACGNNPNHIFFLYGPPGSGKTHLVRAYAAEFSARGGGCRVVSWKAPEWRVEDDSALVLWQNLRTELLRGQALIMDDVDLIGPVLNIRQSLVDLYNHFSFRNLPVLLTAKSPPHTLVDFDEHLRSRFASGLTLAIDVPSMATRASLIAKLAGDHGVTLPEGAAEFILSRCRRDVGTLIRIMRELDRFSLERQRKITLPLVREIARSCGLDEIRTPTTPGECEHESP